MKAVSFQIDHFRSILDSGLIQIQPDVTCLVGKNESGKTAVLHALHMFNPAQPHVKFDWQRQYPAWLEKQHRNESVDLARHVPIRVTFSLDPADIAVIEQHFGQGFLLEKTVSIGRNYSNSFLFELPFNEEVAINHMIADIDLEPEQIPRDLAGVYQLIDRLANLTHETDEAETLKYRQISSDLEKACDTMFGENKNLKSRLWIILKPLIPKFFYFDEYSQLPGSVNIHDILHKDSKDLTAGEISAKALLLKNGADKANLLSLDYETRKRELEYIANGITRDVRQYWSTNPNLKTVVDITASPMQLPDGQQSISETLKLRLQDERHQFSLPFEERSAGFRWFFSFLAAFSAYESDAGNVVILLDEPGLGLHAKAQSDFLRFIDERLSRKCQVIYTTHSPFMVQPGKLERVRLVQDGDESIGSRITADVLAHDRDTLFPLQAALGYELAQHLFISPNNLIVEGTSDFTYLRLVSNYLNQKGRTGLNAKWSIVPVGGADVIPSFVALLGAHLDVTVLIDSRKKGHQKLAQMVSQGLLKERRLITIGEIASTAVADIEDLFDAIDYLKLFNGAFERSFTVEDLPEGGSMVGKCARLLMMDRYDHGRPATVLLHGYADLLPTMSEETLSRFETLFSRINSTLSDG